MSSTSRNFAAILLLLLVAVEFGGGSLLNLLTRRIPGYLVGGRGGDPGHRSIAGLTLRANTFHDSQGEAVVGAVPLHLDTT
jgi:hypothetical protein